MCARKLNITPRPDFERLAKVLRRSDIPDRVPFFDLHSQVVDQVLEAIGQADAVPRSDPDYGTRRHITYMYHLGYDYVNAGSTNFVFPRHEDPKAMTTQGERAYVQAGLHTIASWQDFEDYPWPVMADIDYSPLERISGLLPEGMGVIAGSSGILENVMWLLGYEGISYALYEDEALVAALFDSVGSRIVQYCETQASFDVVGAMVIGEDMGFKTQTLLSPKVYRQYVFPWHRKLVAAVHKHGKPYILHSCGNLTEVMEDIISCGWDARHSFEDAIEPVWESKRKYGDRLALMGGFDMDKLVRMSEEEIRKHTRFLIEQCAPGGGWAMGTGNSVPNYVPIWNFLTMMEEAYHIGVYR